MVASLIWISLEYGFGPPIRLFEDFVFNNLISPSTKSSLLLSFVYLEASGKEFEGKSLQVKRKEIEFPESVLALKVCYYTSLEISPKV
jgi:hypothetical protein